MRGGLEKWIDANVGTRGDCDHDRNLVGWPGLANSRHGDVRATAGVTGCHVLSHAEWSSVSRGLTPCKWYQSVAIHISTDQHSSTRIRSGMCQKAGKRRADCGCMQETRVENSTAPKPGEGRGGRKGKSDEPDTHLLKPGKEPPPDPTWPHSPPAGWPAPCIPPCMHMPYREPPGA